MVVVFNSGDRKCRDEADTLRICTNYSILGIMDLKSDSSDRNSSNASMMTFRTCVEE